jgi:starch-binding outer membrane protein, SusD/RagB family
MYWYKEAYYRAVCQLAAMNKMPPSQDLYSLYDTADLRKKRYYDNNLNINTASLFPPRRKDELVSKSYMKYALNNFGSGYILGVTVPEIMLILAECRARGAGDGENASVILKELRKRRFPTGYADKIGGSLQEVKDERRRELAFVMRWYDVKRYNALDNANIVIKKLGRRDVYQLNSDQVTWLLAPNAPAYALPIPEVEVQYLGWPQNEYGGVSIQ